MTFNEEIWLEKIRKLIVSTLTYGRTFVTLDQNNNPVLYEALDCTNWKQDEYAIFLETKEGYGQDPKSIDPREYIRISHVLGTTYYERFDSSGKLLERKSSKKYKTIPVICVGSTDLDWDVDILPLEGIATCAMHIYKKSADLSYSEFSSCVPTLVMTGVDDTSGNKLIGGGVALSIPNELAKVYYPTTDTNALQHVKIHIDALFEEAKSYGASLLGGDKDEVESAEAIRLRQAASGASLSTMTRTIERAVNRLLELAMIDYKFKINFDLEENYMTPAEQATLLDAWMNNAISYTTYFNNMQKAGLVEDERNIESEKKEIKAEKLQKQKESEENFMLGKNSSNEDKPSVRPKNLSREGLDYETEESAKQSKK